MMKPSTAYLVVLCSLLIHMNVLGSDTALYHTASEVGTIVYFLSQSIAYLLYPLLGWLADVYFTRYKFVRFSFISIIMGSILMVTVAIFHMKYTNSIVVIAVEGISMFICLIAMGSFESTAIQFGMDQMLEASSDQLSTFVNWYNWSCIIGQVVSAYIMAGVLEYFSHCTMELNTQKHNEIHNALHPLAYNVAFTAVAILAGLQLVCACVGLCLLVYYKKHFNIDRTGEHPLKLIYQVLKYAWKHKRPENRSAFTYWEEDIPPRIDLGKSKYGGPFTTEEVEDTKTFFSILLLLLSMIGFHLSGHGYSTLIQLLKTQCPTHWVLIFGDPLQVIFLTTIIGVPLYQLFRKYLSRYNPSMITKMSVGLVCCVVREVTSIILQWTLTSNKEHCRHIKMNVIISCFFLTSDFNFNDVCLSISNVTDNFFYCTSNNNIILLLIIPGMLQGLSYLLVFMTALEFICAQAPLRLKGLLIGIWYALLATNYILVEIPELFTTSSTSWLVYHEGKAFLVFLSIIMYLCVSKRYRYRLRDEVVNEQYLVEEIYERELNQAEKCEQEEDAEMSNIINAYKSYGATLNT